MPLEAERLGDERDMVCATFGSAHSDKVANRGDLAKTPPKAGPVPNCWSTRIAGAAHRIRCAPVEFQRLRARNDVNESTAPAEGGSDGREVVDERGDVRAL
jgi:hypothetical protein